MSSPHKKDVPAFETVEEELNYWKRRYKSEDLKGINKNFFLRCFELENQQNHPVASQNNPVKDELDEPPAKRLKTDDNLMDPFEKLKEDDILEVMKYLSGKELLQAMEVSKSWKKFIESQKLLMNRAMEEVLVKPNLRNFTLPQVAWTFSHRSEKRAYKHMEAPFKLSLNVNPIERHAATLTTLTVKPDNNSSNNSTASTKTLEFSQLKSLTIEKCFLLNFMRYSFPVLEFVKLDNVGETLKLSIFDLRIFLHCCPNLKELELQSCGGFNSLLNGRDFYDAFGNGGINNLFHLDQPKIERITISGYFTGLMNDQKHSLKVLDVKLVNQDDIDEILKNLKVLKSLTIGKFLVDDDPDEFNCTNNSIERLEILRCREGSRTRQTLQDFIKTLTSLKELVLRFDIWPGLITILGKKNVTQSFNF